MHIQNKRRNKLLKDHIRTNPLLRNDGRYLNITLLIGLLCFLMIAGCGSGGDQGSGSLGFDLEWGVSPRYLEDMPARDVCVDYEISSVAVTLYASDANQAAHTERPCNAHYARLDGIAPGINMRLFVEGKYIDGSVTWEGEATGIEVIGGEITTVSKITMHYVGGDHTPPYVVPSSIEPSDGAVDVPVTSMVSAVFSESMAASTINEATFIIMAQSGISPVEAEVQYLPASRKGILSPISHLAYNTEYTVTIKGEVEDTASNNMLSEFSWHFSTEEASSIVPVAPSSLQASPGDSQVQLTWNPVPGAEWYNIYLDSTLGVSESVYNQKRVTTSPSYTWRGLANGIQYYFVVTAENAYGEGPASIRVSGIPSGPAPSILVNMKGGDVTETPSDNSVVSAP